METEGLLSMTMQMPRASMPTRRTSYPSLAGLNRRCEAEGRSEVASQEGLGPCITNGKNRYDGLFFHGFCRAFWVIKRARRFAAAFPSSNTRLLCHPSSSSPLMVGHGYCNEHAIMMHKNSFCNSDCACVVSFFLLGISKQSCQKMPKRSTASLRPSNAR